MNLGRFSVDENPEASMSPGKPMIDFNLVAFASPPTVSAFYLYPMIIVPASHEPGVSLIFLE
jgi:hypothetical protein